jgi:hypothetical protein
MPNKLMAWNALAQTGNPTRSVEVNELIKAVKKAELRKQGNSSSARQSLEQSKYRGMLHILEAKDDFDCKYRTTTLAKFQYNMIARIDDSARFETDDLKENLDFPFTLLCKMCWSKNVLEERDAPDQILLGSMDTDFCVLMALAIYLEHWIEHGDGLQSRFLFSDDIDDGAPKRVKDNIQETLRRDVFGSNAFVRVRPGLLGTHSLRKFASTFARRNGCT